MLHKTLKIALQLLFISATTTLTALPSNRAIAQTAIHSIGTDTAQGSYETSTQEIRLGTTQGVNLSFIRTGETINRVWLDDPSRVVIDFDGCLPSAQFEVNCSDQTAGSSIIRIRQLAERINFPAQAVTGNGHMVSLTVITTTASDNQRKIYQFRLILGNGAPPYSTIEIIPAATPTRAQMAAVTQQYQQEVLGQLSRGLAMLEAEGRIDPNSRAYSQIRTCISLLQQGIPLVDAVRQSAAPDALISELRRRALQTQQ